MVRSELQSKERRAEGGGVKGDVEVMRRERERGREGGRGQGEAVHRDYTIGEMNLQ